MSLFNELPTLQVPLVPGSSPISLEKMDAIFENDVRIAEDKINDWLIGEKKFISQQQFDALIIMRHIHGPLGGTIMGLVLEDAPREKWETTKYLDIGDDGRRSATFDLYFNGKYDI